MLCVYVWRKLLSEIVVMVEASNVKVVMKHKSILIISILSNINSYKGNISNIKKIEINEAWE